MLTDGVDEDLKRIILELQEDIYKIIEMEVIPEYVHLLFDCNQYKSPVDIVKHNIQSQKKHSRKEK